MRDKVSGCPINFGFVVFVNHVVLDRVLQYKNTIDGRTVRFKFLIFFFSMIEWFVVSEIRRRWLEI